MDSSNILQWLEEYCPDRAPSYYLDAYALGIIVGQREMIEHLKIKLKIDKPIEETIK